MSNGPLSGVTVIDLTRALAGPYATLLLSGLGATVIRIEEPGLGDGRHNAPFLGKDGPSLRRQHEDDVSIAHLIRHRGKQSITMNLKHADAKAMFAELVAHADVVVENYTRGTAERLGVGYKQAKAVKPDIIYCSISGYGHEGGSDGRAMDGIIQALSGIMLTSGEDEAPPVRIGVPFADLNTPLYAVIGIVSALYHRAQTGEGQLVDVSMLGAMTSLQSIEPFEVLEQLGVPMRTGNSVPRLTPFGTYAASDGDVVVCCSGDKNFRKISDAMEQPDLPGDERFTTQANRLVHYKDIDRIVGDWMAGRTVEEAVARLDAFGVAAAPVRTPGEAMRDPRVLARKEIVPLQHPKYGPIADLHSTGVPIVFSRTKAEFDPMTAALGEHNKAVFGDLLGRSDEELARLKSDGAI